MAVVKEEILQIKKVLKKNPRGINVIDIAKEVNMNRQTVTKYLEILIVSGNVDVKTFGPSKVYYLTQRLPVSSMISLSSDFILLIDRNLNVVNVNDSFLEFTKTKKDDILGKGINAIPFPMEFDPPIAPNINDAIEGKESRIDAYYKKRGKEHFYSIKFIPIAFDEGQPGATILFEDITERKRAEDSLRKLSMAVEQSPATVVITDLQGSIEYVNPRFTYTTGYTREEAIGQNPRILKSGETPRAVYRELWDTVLSGGEWHGEFHNRKKNGEYYWESALIAPVKDSRGNITHIMAVKEDITERKRSEETLRESESRQKVAEAVEVERRRLLYVLETLPAMICLLTADHRIVFANRSFTERFGQSAGRPCYETCFGLSKPCDFCESYKVFKTGQPHHWEVNTHDGSVIEAHDYPFTDVDGTSLILEMDVDITEQKRIEKELKKANRAYKVMAKCKEAMIHAEDEKALLEKICQIIVSIGDYLLAWIGYVEDDEARTVRPVAWAGINDGYIENLRIAINDPVKGEGPTAQCLKTGKPLTVGDVRSDPRMAPWREDATARGFLATLNIPIVYDNHVIGNIAVYAGEADAFNENELGLMFELAGNLAYGITVLRDRSKRFAAEEELRQSRDELELRVKERTKELKESEERFRALADNIPNLAWMAVADGWIFWYNKQWYEYTGTTLEEMQGWGWQKVHHPDYVKAVTDEWSARIKEGKPYDNIFPLRGKDGQYRWFLTRVTPIKDEQGKIQRWFGTNTDVTDWKQAEKALQVKQEELEAQTKELEAKVGKRNIFY